MAQFKNVGVETKGQSGDLGCNILQLREINNRLELATIDGVALAYWHKLRLIS